MPFGSALGLAVLEAGSPVIEPRPLVLPCARAAEELMSVQLKKITVAFIEVRTLLVLKGATRAKLVKFLLVWRRARVRSEEHPGQELLFSLGERSQPEPPVLAMSVVQTPTDLRRQWQFPKQEQICGPHAPV